MATPTRSTDRSTWRVIGVMGVVAVLLAGVVFWIRNSSDVDTARPAATGASSSSSPAASDGASTTSVPPASRALSEPCGFVSSGLVDAVRECRVLRPKEPAGDPARLPVVIFLHGLGGDVTSTITVAGLTDAVARDRFLAVVPQGVLGSWNAGKCCGLAQGTGVDDVTYLRSLVSLISQRPDADTARIYLVGFSNGGMMAYRFLCDASEDIAGMVSVMGTNVSDCAPKRPRPVLHIAGTGDTTVPYDGGKSLVAAILGVDLPPVEESMQEIATSEGCGRRTRVRESAGVTRTQWEGCADESTVELLTLDGVGHEWPTRAPIDTTAVALAFLGIGP